MASITTPEQTARSLVWKSALLGAAIYSLPRISEFLPANLVEKIPVAKKTLQVFLALTVARHLGKLALAPRKDKSWDWGKEVVVVTGGSSGIGELIVKSLAGRGVKVVALDVNPPKASLGEYFPPLSEKRSGS